MKKVIELIRVSTERQAASDRASIPAQRTVNRQTCRQYGLQIVRTIEFADVSGASVRSAPEIQELMRLIQSPDIEGVVAREFSRLMRPENLEDFGVLQAFGNFEIILYLPDGPIDFNNKSGRVFGVLRAAMAGAERTENLERIWTAKEEKRRRGELGQSSIVLPFGVGYDEEKKFYYKPEAELVRDAFRQFLAGVQSYAELAKIVGVKPRTMHNILRNPIWTGFRVIDKKRDLSPAGRYLGKNGRQADRRKIVRTPEEVIRVRVIDEPLVRQDDFDAVQRVMDLKQKKHWRSRTSYEHRFIYNGFVTCSACGEIIHTVWARRDYYACKGRRIEHKCKSKYMIREKLEAVLDGLFSKQLTDVSFLEGCVDQMSSSAERSESGSKAARLAVEVEQLRRKRARVVNAFIEGLIEPPERDKRLALIDGSLKAAETSLAAGNATASLDAAALIAAFAPLSEWEFWSREQKRLVLSTLVPDIRVADYEVESVGLDLALLSNEDTRTDRDSWPRPA